MTASALDDVMAEKREKEPFIQKGDEVHIFRPGSLSGLWKVAAARYMSNKETDTRIEMVLSRGGGMMFKIKFDETSMRLRNNTPDYMLSRDIFVKKPLNIKPKDARP